MDQLCEESQIADPVQITVKNRRSQTRSKLLANLNGELIPISFVAIDENGLYTKWAGWTPCFDDDWRCENGHWNPQYEGKCVTCKKPRKPNSPRWKDYK